MSWVQFAADTPCKLFPLLAGGRVCSSMSTCAWECECVFVWVTEEIFILFFYFKILFSKPLKMQGSIFKGDPQTQNIK